MIACLLVLCVYVSVCVTSEAAPVHQSYSREDWKKKSIINIGTNTSAAKMKRENTIQLMACARVTGSQNFIGE